MYLNDKIFQQYEKMQRTGKYANEVEEYPYIGMLNKTDPNTHTSYTQKNKYLVRLQIKINKDSIITDIKFKAVACTVVLASMSIACEMLHNKPFEEAIKLKNDFFVKRLEIPEDQPEKNSIMVEEVIQSMINVMDFKQNG